MLSFLVIFINYSFSFKIRPMPMDIYVIDVNSEHYDTT